MEYSPQSASAILDMGRHLMELDSIAGSTKRDRKKQDTEREGTVRTIIWSRGEASIRPGPVASS